jgi:hypothetical protein
VTGIVTRLGLMIEIVNQVGDFLNNAVNPIAFTSNSHLLTDQRHGRQYDSGDKLIGVPLSDVGNDV